MYATKRRPLYFDVSSLVKSEGGWVGGHLANVTDANNFLSTVQRH